MDKKQIYKILGIVIFTAFSVFSGIKFRLSDSYAAPPIPPAPNDANYLVTALHQNLTAEILTTQITTHLIAASSSNNLGSSGIPWGAIFGNIVTTNTLSSSTASISATLETATVKASTFTGDGAVTLSSGNNQNISLNPGAGKVLANSLVVNNLPNDPSGGQAGQIYFNTSTHRFRGYDGADWETFAFVASPSIPTIIFSDNFNRADAGSWGNPSDGSATWSNVAGHSNIVSNAGRITGDNAATTPTNYHSISQQNDLVITFKMLNWDGSGPGFTRFAQVRSNGGNRDGWGLIIDSIDDVRLDDNGIVKQQTNFTFTTGNSYNVEMDISAGNGIDLFIWDSTVSKPSSSTLSQPDWTPSTSGSNWEMGNSDNGASVWELDDLVIQAN